MTRETFMKARKDALLRYKEVAQDDLKLCKTQRELNNCKRRIALAESGLKKIDNGKFWDSLTECAFSCVYQFYDESWTDAIPAF